VVRGRSVARATTHTRPRVHFSASASGGASRALCSVVCIVPRVESHVRCNC
jgi:hypothetical protein